MKKLENNEHQQKFLILRPHLSAGEQLNWWIFYSVVEPPIWQICFVKLDHFSQFQGYQKIFQITTQIIMVQWKMESWKMSENSSKMVIFHWTLMVTGNDVNPSFPQNQDEHKKVFKTTTQ